VKSAITKNEANQLVILETLGKAPATKTLIIDAQGNRDAIPYGRALKYWGKVYQPTSIFELSALLENFTHIPNAMAVRGVFRNHVDLRQPVYRRKDERKYPQAPETVCLKEAPLCWAPFDLDKLALKDLGFDQPLAELKLPDVCGRIIDQYLPELANVTHHAQYSSTAGWRDPHTASVHLFYWLDRPMTNAELKAYAHMVNARAEKTIVDPALYQAAQPIYIANPLLGTGVDHDHLPVRSALVKKERDVLSLPHLEPATTAKPTAKKTAQPKKAKAQTPKNKPTKFRIRPHSKTLEGWLELIPKVNEGVHEVLLDVTLFIAQKKGLWADWGAIKVKLEKAFRASVRAERDPGRIDAMFNDGEYDRAVEGAKILAKQLFWHKYSSHLILSHDDTVQINERYLQSVEPSKTLVIDSDLGTGKTEWFYVKVIKNRSLGRHIVCLIPRRSLAKTTATRFFILDYEEYKNAGFKKRRNMDTRALSVCTNSSLTLINPAESQNVVFMDESDLNIQHLFSGAVSDNIREQLIYHNLEMVRNADYVICAQSLVSELTLAFLKLAGRENIVKVVNTYQPWDGLPIDFFRKKEKALERLWEIADKGTPFLCACNSSGQALRNFLATQERHPDKKYLLITNDTATEPEQSAFLANPNKHAHKYDGIFYSPSMESGVSIDVDHFKETIGFCSANQGVGTPEAFVQMLLRGRTAKRISIWVDPQKHDLPTTDERVAREAIGRFDLAAKFVEHDGKQGIFFEKTPVIELAMKARSLENKSKNNTDLVVYALLTKRMGCNVNLIDSNPSELGLEAQEAGTKLGKAHYQSHISSAFKISQAESEALQKKNSPTIDEQWQLRRYRLEQELVLDLDEIPDESSDDTPNKQGIFDLWKQGRVVRSLRSFEEGFLTIEQAKAVARHLLANKAPYSEIQGFTTRYLIRKGLMKSLKITIDKDGNLACDPNFKFKYSDLMKTWWYRFACANRDAVNGSSLGCRIRGRWPNENVIGMWINAMGISLKRLQEDVADLPSNILKDKKGGSATKRHQVALYSVNLEKMQPLTPIIKRRHQSGVSAWRSLAAKVLSQVPTHNALESCEAAIRALLPSINKQDDYETVIALSDQIGDQFDQIEINETYYRLVA